jgi:hypothetical protein
MWTPLSLAAQQHWVSLSQELHEHDGQQEQASVVETVWSVESLINVLLSGEGIDACRWMVWHIH